MPTSGVNITRRRSLRQKPRIAAFLLTFFFTAFCGATAQTQSPSTPNQTSMPFSNGETNTPLWAGDEGADLSQGRDSALQSDSGFQPVTLSSDQIISILEQEPDLRIELKSQLADRLQQQGTAIDPADITDQAFYNQISTNANLRTSISAVLQARGILSNEDIQSFRSGGSIDAAQSASPLAQRSPINSGGLPGGLGSTSVPEEGAPGTLINGASGNSALPMRARNPRGHETANASTDAPVVVHQPTPLNLQSMRDLYAQIPDTTVHLERFGSDVFVNRNSNTNGGGISGRDTPLDVPLGPDYVVGPGDKLTIDLWGNSTQTFQRTVDSDGRILLPDAGAIQVAGLALNKVQSLMEALFKPLYRNAQVAVTVSGLRSVRVYVVGDVQRPGGYDISSLATPLSALYAAGGPTAVGSLRTLQHYRGQKLVEQVDLYDFLLHGIRNGSASFESGDTLLVPPAGPQVAISGAVRRQAIYELKPGESTLAALIDTAGGFTAAASLHHIEIERIDANHQRETVTLPSGNGQDPKTELNAAASFAVKDADRIKIEPILPYSQRAVYMVGHVARPGRIAYADGMRLSDVIRSYQDLLPEPAAHGEIVRLVPPDLHAETLDFNIPDVLIGNANTDLQPFDTIRVFGRYQVDAPTVTIRGEVMRPGQYPMSQGMTAAQLVRMAGGFKRDALLEEADLTSYEVEDGHQVSEKLAVIHIGAAVSGPAQSADIPLKPGDILAVHQITNWNDIGESITISGQVRYPGSYGFREGERLSSVLQRAGGLLPTAYPLGAVLVRAQVRELEQSSRDELVRQIEANSAAARVSPGISGSNGAGAVELIKAQQNQVIADLKNHPPTGRMVIHISSEIGSWTKTSNDVELRPGDELIVPKQPGFVLVTGQVYNSTALTFEPGKTARWYLQNAGGTNASANRKEIFVIRANGSVVGRHSGNRFDGDVLSTRLNPGDVVVVPQKIIGGSVFWRNLLATGQLAASVAVSAEVAAATL